MGSDAGIADTGPGGETTSEARDAWKSHVTLAVGLALCALAFWFELGRALRGNSLSWAYVFEWPLLGAFAVYMWWRVNHPEAHTRRVVRPPVVAPEFEGMLAAWQEHQRDLLAAHEHPSDDGDPRS